MFGGLAYPRRLQRIVSFGLVFILTLGLGLPGMALADETDLNYPEFGDGWAIDKDTHEDTEISPLDDSEDTGLSLLDDSEVVEVLPPGANGYTVVVSSGVDNLVVPLNTRSAGSEDDHGGDWVFDQDSGYYCPWIEIVDGSGQQVSGANVEVSWSGSFAINWRRSEKLILYNNGRLLIQYVEPANWSAIEPGTLIFTFTVKSRQTGEVLGSCSVDPIHITWDWGPWVQVDSGLDNLTIPADTWSTGSWDSHGSTWVTGADFRFYPSVRVVDGNDWPIEEEMTVTWDGDFLINGKRSGELRLVEGDLMIHSIEPGSGVLPQEASEILLDFSFRGAGRDYRFDDVGPIRINWVETMVDEDDSHSSPYEVYIDGDLGELNLTVPTQSWSTAASDNPGGWSQDWDDLYYPSIWVLDNNFSSFWADVTVYWDGPYRINWCQSGDLRLWESQLMITRIEPQEGAVLEDVSSIKFKLVVKPQGSSEVYTYSNIAVNVTWSERFPLKVRAYEVHPDSQLDTHTICDLWLVEYPDGEEMLTHNERKESLWSGLHWFYPWQGSWRASMSAPGYTPRVIGDWGDAWSDLITLPPDSETQEPPELGLSFFGETSEPNPHVYWRNDTDEISLRVQGRYQIDFDIPVKTSEVAERVSLWKDDEQVEAQIVPVRPMDDPDYGTIAVLFSIYPTDGYQESDPASSLQSFYTIRIDAGAEAYHGNTTSRGLESTVEAHSGGGGQELEKIGLGPSDETENPDESKPPVGTDNPNPSNPQAPQIPATPGGTGTPATLGSQGTEFASTYPASSTERDEISGAQTPLASDPSATPDKPPVDSYKETQRSGPLPNPSGTQNRGFLLVLLPVVFVGLGLGAGCCIHMRRKKVKRV